jgi:hypothetical protein
MAYVLAQRSSNDIGFFQYPNYITHDLRYATKYGINDPKNAPKGFYFITIEQAKEEIKKKENMDG